MDREKLDGWCEQGILALVLAILVFGPLALGAVEPWQWLIVEGLTIGVMALWALRLWVSRRPQFLWPPICWAVVAFLAYAAVRYSQADVEYAARREVIRILVYALLFFAILNNLHRQESAQALALAPVFLGMVIAAYACVQFVRKSDIVWNLHSHYLGRGSGTFIYPNSLSAFLEMLVPLALSYALIGRLSHVAKVLAGYAAAVMLAGIAVSLSRGGLIVTAVTLAVLCGVLLTQRDYWLRGLALAVVLAAAGAVVLPGEQVTQRLLRATESPSAPDDSRLALWQVGAEIWRDHPWLGVGPGLFDYHYRQYRPAIDQRDPDRLHNDYLNLLVDWGVIGGALVASAWVLLAGGIRRSWKVVRGSQADFARKKSNKFALMVGGCVGLLAILLHSLVDFNLDVPAVAILMVTLMALLSSQVRFATERYWANLGAGLKTFATLILAAGICLLGSVGWRSAREEYWLGQAARKPDLSFARQTILEKAFAAEPKNADTAWQIGECCRTRSFLNQTDDPDVLATQAMDWYRRGIKLNPHDPYNWTGCGMCLDWINAGDAASREEAARDYDRADALDPNGYFVTALIGRHYVQTGDYAAARTWFERSLRLQWADNQIASRYLTNVQNWLETAAARQKPENGTPGVRGSPETPAK